MLSLCACGSATAPQQAEPAPAADAAPTENSVEQVENVDEIEPLTVRFGDPSTTGSFVNKQIVYYADCVDKLSGGKIKVDVFSDSLLGTETAMATSVQDGSIEMSVFLSTFSTMVPKAGIFDLPYLISDRDQINKLYDEGILQPIFDDAESVNMKVLGFGENGFRHLTNNKRPIVVPDDLKGLVIRVPQSEIRSKTFETLGASPIGMAWSEVYQALEQGVCDGQENPFSQIGGAQLYNVQKYLSLSSHIYTPFYVVMNLKLYNSLSEAQKAVFAEAMDMLHEYAMELGKAYDEEQLAACGENGMEINEVDVDAFRSKLLPLWDQYQDMVGGEEFVNSFKTTLGY